MGGTFTDVAVIAGGKLVTAKVPTTPGDHSLGVIEGVRLALAEAALAAADVAHFGHGTTVATNAMLERRGARTAFVATRGFGDIPALGRQARPHLYRPEVAPPAPLAEIAAEVDERMGPGGVLRPLQAASVAAAERRLRRERVEAVAVCLLHAYADPVHEREVADRLRAALPGVHVVASHEVAAEFREFERASTTIADAYLGPVTGGYLRRLAETAPADGLPPPAVMQSNGGVCGLDEAAAHPARLLLSGPAGGVAAVVAAGNPRCDQLRHGRHVDRRLPDPGRRGRAQRRAPGRRPAAAPPAARHPHRRRRRRQHRLARPRRCAAGGAAERRCRSRAPPATGAAASCRPSPMRTSSSGGSTPRCRCRAACAWTCARPGRRCGRWRGHSGACAPPPRGSWRSPTPRWCARSAWSASSRATTRASSSWSRSAAPGRCTRARWPTAWECGAVVVPAAGGVLSALGIAAGERRRVTVRSVMQPLAEFVAGLDAPPRRAPRGIGRDRVRAALPRPGA